MSIDSRGKVAGHVERELEGFDKIRIALDNNLPTQKSPVLVLMVLLLVLLLLVLLLIPLLLLLLLLLLLICLLILWPCLWRLLLVLLLMRILTRVRAPVHSLLKLSVGCKLCSWKSV